MAMTLLSPHSLLLSHLCLFFSLTSHVAVVQPASLQRFSCDLNIRNFRQPCNGQSPTDQEISALLSNLSSHTEINYGFYNFSSGPVSAIGLCRGDVNPRDCRTCLNDTGALLMEHCPCREEATVWVDGCMVRYSTTRNILGVVDTSSYKGFSCNGTGSMKQSSAEIMDLLDEVKAEAASGDSTLKFATKNNQSVYAVAQCTPDLSEEDCTQCFDSLFPNFQQRCGGTNRGFAISPSCNIRYDFYRFYADTPQQNASSPSLPPLSPGNGSQLNGSSLSPPPPPTAKGMSHTTRVVVLYVAVPVTVTVTVAFTVRIICKCWLKKGRNSKKQRKGPWGAVLRFLIRCAELCYC